MITAGNLDQTIPIVCNAGDDAVRAQVIASSGLDLPWLDLAKPHDRAALIVGGGPSMRAARPFIRALAMGAADIFATNGVLPSLAEAGITRARYQVLLDARPENVRFVQGPKPGHYLIASQCHPDLFAAIAGHPTTIWHPAYPEISEWIGHREAVLIGGGTTVGLQAMSIAYAMGYRALHLFGFDSSYSDDGAHHAYVQALNDGDDREEVFLGDQRFIVAPWMARQALEFVESARQLIEGGAQICVHGSGLLPAIAAQSGMT